MFGGIISLTLIIPLVYGKQIYVPVNNDYNCISRQNKAIILIYLCDELFTGAFICLEEKNAWNLIFQAFFFSFVLLL